MRIIDISSELLSADCGETDPQPRLQRLSRMDDGGEDNRTALYASLHTGTHITAPSAVFEEEDEPETVSAFPPETFIGPVMLVSLPSGPVTGDEIERYFPRLCSRVILRSSGPFTFFGGAADDLAALGYALIGFEGAHLGGAADAAEEQRVRRALLKPGTVLLEGLDLRRVTHGGEYYLFAPPVRLNGTEAAPARAVLLEELPGQKGRNKNNG